MKSISKLLVSTAALLLAGNLFAEPNCPPTSTVENAQFTRAFHFSLGSTNQDVWGMLTNNFEFDGKLWNVGFAVVLQGVNSPEEALQKGQPYFKTISLKDPLVLEYDDQLQCVYANSSSNYLVVAGAPPLNGPDNLKKLLK